MSYKEDNKWCLVLHLITDPMIKIEDNQVADHNFNNILKVHKWDRCNKWIPCKWILWLNKWDTHPDNLKIISCNKEDKDSHLNNLNSLVHILKCQFSKISQLICLLYNNNLIQLINSKIMLPLSNAWMNLINFKLKYREIFWEIS